MDITWPDNGAPGFKNRIRKLKNNQEQYCSIFTTEVFKLIYITLRNNNGRNAFS